MTTPNSMRYRCNCGGRIYVRETRAADDAIYRIRKCKECGYLFTTKEVAIEGYIPKHAILQGIQHDRLPIRRQKLERNTLG